MTDKKALLDQIRALDFAILETGMFLNTTPCEEGVAYLEKTNKARCAAVSEYERLYGPLTARNAAESGKWAWTKGPWPWESEAN